MFAELFTFSLVGLMAAMILFELHRYRAAQVDPEGIAYPRRRLSRRIGVALLIILILLTLYFVPEELAPQYRLAAFGLCFIAGLMAVALAFRDLHETSLTVVEENRRFQEKLEEDMRRSTTPDETEKRSEPPRTPRV